MIAHATAWLRFAILELLSRNPAGATLAQIATALESHDPEHRVGRIFQTARESGDIMEVNPRGTYALTERGLQSLERMDGMQLPNHVTLPSRDAVKTATPQPGRSETLSVYHKRRETEQRTTLPMRKPEDRPPVHFGDDESEGTFDTRETTPRGRRQMNILRVLRESRDAMSPADIFAALRDDTTRTQVNTELQRLTKRGQIVGAGNTSSRRYTIPGREHLLVDIETKPRRTNPTGNGMSGPLVKDRRIILELLHERAAPMSFSEICDGLGWTRHRKTLRLQIRRLVDAGEIAAAGQTKRRRYAALMYANGLHAAAGEITARKPTARDVETLTLPEPAATDPRPGRSSHQLIIFAIDNAMASLAFLKETLEEAQQ